MDKIGIILAAGKGSRLNSYVPKPFQLLAGEYLLNYVIHTMKLSGLKKIYVVVSPEISSMDYLSDYDKDIKFIIQKAPRGTGDALKTAVNYIESNSIIIVAPCDVPLVNFKTVKTMLDTMKKNSVSSNVLIGKAKDPSGYGRVIYDESKKEIISIVEHNDLNESQNKIDIINSSWYCFKNDWVKNKLSEIDLSANGEMLLTDIFNVSDIPGETVYTMVEDHEEIIGINSKLELEKAEKILRNSINKQHMLNGVNILDSNTTYIDKKVKILPDTIIYPNTYIRGDSSIKKSVTLGPNTIIENSKIDEGSTIISSFVTDSSIGKNCQIGPNSRIRNECKVSDNCLIGNGAEIKKSIIGDASKISHFSYIGDSILGKNVNIGAGTVTCNYDGIQKNSTFIGDDVFIGAGTMLIAPINISSNSRTGAGSVVNSDVDKNQTVVGIPATPIKLNES